MRVCSNIAKTLLAFSTTSQPHLSVEVWEYDKLQKQLQKPEIPTVESWLAKRKLKNATDTELKTANITWTYPEHLEMRADLPPSVRKFNPDEFVDADFAEWGE